MSKSTTCIRSWPALAGGLVAGGAMTALLARDVLQGGWTVEIALAPVVVGLTVLAAHVARQASWGLRIALSGLALFGSAWMILESSGRRAELRDAKVGAVVDVERERTRLRKMLVEAEEILSGHRRAADLECSTGKGKLCEGKRYTVSTWEAAVAGYESKLKALPPPRPADAKADRIAAVLAVAGFEPAKVKEVVGQIDPLLLAILCELMTIAFMRLAFGHRTVSQLPARCSETRSVSGDAETVIAALRRASRPVSNDELAALMGVTKSEASKRVRNCGNRVRVAREGKFNQISLMH